MAALAAGAALAVARRLPRAGMGGLAEPPATRVLLEQLGRMAEAARTGGPRAAAGVLGEDAWPVLRSGAGMLARGEDPARLKIELLEAVDRTLGLVPGGARMGGTVQRVARAIFPAAGLASVALGLRVATDSAARTAGEGGAFLALVALFLVAGAMRNLGGRADPAAVGRYVLAGTIVAEGLAMVAEGRTPEDVGRRVRALAAEAEARERLALAA